MQSPDRETVKGMLLDRWLEDLRQDRAPSVLPDLQHLSQQEIAETLALARWLAATEMPKTLAAEIDSVAAAVRTRIRRSKEQERQDLDDAVEKATSFGGLLVAARQVRQVKPDDLERALRLPPGTLQQLESALAPPHRVPFNAMLALLRSLRVASGKAIELLRQASREWASRVYIQPATQLGRINPQLDAESRQRLLTDANVQEDPHALLAEELDRIEQYYRALAAQLR